MLYYATTSGLEELDVYLSVMEILASEKTLHRIIEKKFQENPKLYFQSYKASEHYCYQGLERLGYVNASYVEMLLGINKYEMSTASSSKFTMNLISKGFRECESFFLNNLKKPFDLHGVSEVVPFKSGKSKLGDFDPDKIERYTLIYLYLLGCHNLTIPLSTSTDPYFKVVLKAVKKRNKGREASPDIKVGPDTMYEYSEVVDRIWETSEREGEISIADLCIKLGIAELSAGGLVDFVRTLVDSRSMEPMFNTFSYKLFWGLQGLGFICGPNAERAIFEEPVTREDITKVLSSFIRSYSVEDLKKLQIRLLTALTVTGLLLLVSYRKLNQSDSRVLELQRKDLIRRVSEDEFSELKEREAELQSKVKSLESKLKSMEDFYEDRFEKTNFELLNYERKVNKLLKELDKQSGNFVAVKNLTNFELAAASEIKVLETQESLSDEEMISLIQSKRVAIVGGHANWIKKMKAVLPGVIFFDLKEQGNKDLSPLMKLDMILCFWRHNDHKFVFLAESIFDGHVVFGNIGDHVNVSLSIREIYHEMVKLKVL